MNVWQQHLLMLKMKESSLLTNSKKKKIKGASIKMAVDHSCFINPLNKSPKMSRSEFCCNLSHNPDKDRTKAARNVMLRKWQLMRKHLSHIKHLTPVLLQSVVNTTTISFFTAPVKRIYHANSAPRAIIHDARVFSKGCI